MVYKELLVIAIVSVAFASTFCINVFNPCVCHNYMCIYVLYIPGLFNIIFILVNCMHYKPDIV